MLGNLVDEIARHAARLRVGRVRVPGGVTKINLGSGLHVAPGWINVDGSIHSMLSGAPAPVLSLLYRNANSIKQGFSEAAYIRTLQDNRFVFAQLEGRLPFEDAVADFVYSSHVLEHFFLDDARLLLGEVRRILKPGGVVRICVPDLDHAVGLHGEGRSREAVSYFYADSRAGYYRQHRYMYDFQLLADLLGACGFSDVTRREYRSGRVPDLDQLDNRPEETLYVEASRGS